MSDFKPTLLWLREKIYADEHRQRVRNKLIRFLEENPEMESYLDWRNNQKFNTGILVGFLFTVGLLILVLEGYLLGV